MQNLSPSSLVKIGSNLQALFDHGQWYDGEVTKVYSYGTDFSGKYIKCDVTYSDGEVDDNIKLYDKYFETDDEDAWRFKEEFSKVIHVYNDLIKEIEAIKSDVDDLMDNVADLIEEEDNGKDEGEDEDEDEDVDTDAESENSGVTDDSAFDTEKDHVIEEVSSLKWYMIGNFIGILLGFSASHLVKCYDVVEMLRSYEGISYHS